MWWAINELPDRFSPVDLKNVKIWWLDSLSSDVACRVREFLDWLDNMWAFPLAKRRHGDYSDSTIELIKAIHQDLLKISGMTPVFASWIMKDLLSDYSNITQISNK